MFTSYNHKELESQVFDYWEKNRILGTLREKNKKGRPYYFLEGPPYTSGHIHLGHAWNTALKDIVLRYKRMRGYNVWDRMGYDMHGLPTEQKVMAKLNLKNKEGILAFGLQKFMGECHSFCTGMMEKMNEDFLRIGSTLDFSRPYQPITKEYMEAEWWLVKKAHEKGRLYQGLKTMHWDFATQTAVAKHELEYKRITDTSLYMKFPVEGRTDTYFVIWTTTPWTIPLNLAIMVNPDLAYVEIAVDGEHWIVAKDLLEQFMAKTGRKYRLRQEYAGRELEGWSYHHPLNTRELLPRQWQDNPKVFTVLLTKEYVDTSAGTGLVHAAPGCGPEDYEVGHQNGIPPFNCVNEEGVFEDFGNFTGLKAKLDDKTFIELIEQSGSVVAKEPYTHDYPHGERSHQPVIFRTTSQWFFKVEDLKEKMLAANEDIYWNPQAGKNAFRSWLENLRDNSITKQRYWGTPVPIWQAEDGEFIVVGSVQELEALSGKTVEEMHIPQIDEVTITKNGKTYRRIPDVLDVWIDAGTASWNCLDYPQHKEAFQKFFPADFILEGKDQIRGWYNLLMVASFLALDKPSFKSVYMHGFVTDMNGIKMSKSLGNIISPRELTDKHGADVLRYYMCQTTAGEDINFSWEECAQKQRNLLILWNIHKLLLTMAKEQDSNPFAEDMGFPGVEERYILSRLHSTIKEATHLLEEYRLDEVIPVMDSLFLDLSRTYVQLVREKSSVGNEEEKSLCAQVIARVLLDCLKMFQLVAPFLCEAIYLNLKEAFTLKEESISHYSWPVADEHQIDLALEKNMAKVSLVVQAALHAREKAKLGLRWPVSDVLVVSTDDAVQEGVNMLQDILRTQLNAREVRCVPAMGTVSVKPDYAALGPVYGSLSPQIIAKLAMESPQTILGHIGRTGYYEFDIEGNTVRVKKEMLKVEYSVPPGYSAAEFKMGRVYLNTIRTAELDAEGYAREVMRQIQSLRKNAGLEKQDRISLLLKTSEEMHGMLLPFKEEMMAKVGAVSCTISDKEPLAKQEGQGSFTVKDEQFYVRFHRV